MTSEVGQRPVVVVTGANGLVGRRVCEVLSERGVVVRAVVRRAGTAPQLDGLEEHVGDFADADLAAAVTTGADAVVTTVHPMGSDLATQHRVGVEETPSLARAARDAGVARFVHLSTCAVYDRSPGLGDVDESSALVGDDAGDYPVTKRDADAALARVDGITRVLVRPPAILGRGDTSVWNTLRPTQVRDEPSARHDVERRTFSWVHVDDLAAMVADVATGRIETAADPAEGPLEGGCTAVDVAGEPATVGDYLGTVTAALGLEPVWEDGPAWTGQILTDRARGWGWTPRVTLAKALADLKDDVRRTVA
ncbi:NAD-dependent epimerase/dehydratase family protein [Microlunatus antarcticus]|uniref:Nucleoside-diphosphate-sugar epimerase n=1 Tax=Microlunatus antarcticus TaxID=53388 RepID=A0A7W5P8Y8_9ACTN|nr:NAD(P)-dependent oxidoreductase [Microlunatus antarcticus]MBB3329017.1 nucleoside-diphosphate-sugar epimerase [Microlunatus antarcticus]